MVDLFSYRKHVHWADVKDAVTDLGLWGHLIITAVGLTPTSPLSVCKSTKPCSSLTFPTDASCVLRFLWVDLPSVIKTFDFSVFVANALTAPPYILQCITTVLFIWHSDKIRERGFHGAFGGKHYLPYTY